MWSCALAKILIVDNTFDPPHGSPEIVQLVKSIACETGISVDLEVARAPESRLPSSVDGFRAVILSGSKTRILENAPWIDAEMRFIEELHQKKIPTLGICYGEQLIVRVLGGIHTTGISEKAEYGWTKIEKNAVKDDLFLGVDPVFHTFSFHSDEVFSLPSGFTLLASSERCQVQAFRVNDYPMWGLQFHCERGLEQGNRSLTRKREQDPKMEIVNFDQGATLFDANLGRRIFSNFLRQAKVVP